MAQGGPSCAPPRLARRRRVETFVVAIDRACRGKCAVLEESLVRNRGSTTRLPEPKSAGGKEMKVPLAVRQRLGGTALSFCGTVPLDLAVRRLSSWAALECRAEGPACVPSRGLVSESAVHVVAVISPRSNRAVLMSKQLTLGPGPGRAVCGQGAESQESMLVPSNCQGARGLCTCEVLALG